MVITIHDGGATRYVTAGAKRTRSADHTRPAAPTCATQPATRAIGRETIASGTTAMPATCAMAIRGIARKLSPRPAKVMRENVSAPIGKSNASTASVAANIAKADRPTQATHEVAAACLPLAGATGSSRAVATGTTTRIASVAPKVNRNAGSETI